MVKLDLKRWHPYETSDGIADFHDAGRHIKTAMRYTRVGLETRAKALESLPWLNSRVL